MAETLIPVDDIYSEYKKMNKQTTPIPYDSDANLSYMLRTNNIDNVEVLQLSEYVKKKQPLTIYVSSLLRTWETAFLLFLPFLNNSTSTDYDPEYTPTIVLVVSPFLIEKQSKGVNASNTPGNIGDSIMQFLKFIDLYILLSNNVDDYVKNEEAFSRDPKKFNIVVEFTPTSKLYISIDATNSTSIVFNYDLSNTGIDDNKKKEIETYVNKRVSLSEGNIVHIKDILNLCYATYVGSPINSIISFTPYKKYNNAIDKNTAVNLPFALTPMDESNFLDFNIFSVYFPDIFNYLKWVICIKKHPKNIPILVVSHSGTMQKFLKKIFSCFFNKVNNLQPSNSFITTYTDSINSNLWSLRLHYMGYSVIIFRHGYTCDNMYKDGGLNLFFDRLSGYYTHLNIWGIYSIKFFCKNEYSLFSDITDIKNNLLSIKYGFEKQPKNIITKKSLPNEITCGSDIKLRFNYQKEPTGSENSLNFTSNSVTDLKKFMQSTNVNSFLGDSTIDSDIDKGIQSLISIEFTDCPKQSLFSTLFGCIKLSCVYTKRYAIIRPYVETGKIRYEISLYDETSSKPREPVRYPNVEIISNNEKIILVYEKILLFLFNIEDTDPSSDSSILSNFSISCVVNILMDKKLKRIVSMLTNETQHRIDINTSLYDIEQESSSVISFPSFIYVSELLRTWETAVLLFLNDRNTDLTLYISPYLREVGLLPFTSDRPGELKEQVNEFIRFISFLIFLKKLKINFVSPLIPSHFSITLKYFNEEFNKDFISDMNIPKDIGLTIVEDDKNITRGGILISVTIPPEVTKKNDVSNDKVKMMTELPKKLNKMYNFIETPFIQSYTPYNDNPNLTFPPKSPKPDAGSMDKPSTPPGSLTDFMTWYESLSPKPHGNDTAYVVCHSGTMKKFLEELVKGSATKPSQQFNLESKEAFNTNTWSLFYNKDGNKFKVFRHAFSCDNELMEEGVSTFFKRFSVGDYTHLASWGILSTLVFANRTIEKLIKDDSISTPGLKISKGMKLEPLDLLTDKYYDGVSVLCGEQRDRFKVGTFVLSLGNCGKSSSKGYNFDDNCIQIITKPDRKKVVLFYNKTTTPPSIEARFFDKVQSEVYDPKENIVLGKKSLKDSLITIAQHLTIKAIEAKKTNIYTEELLRTITSFINRTLSTTPWKPTWQQIFSNSDLAILAGGRNTKKIRRYKKRNVMNKYTIKNK